MTFEKFKISKSFPRAKLIKVLFNTDELKPKIEGMLKKTTIFMGMQMAGDTSLSLIKTLKGEKT